MCNGGIETLMIADYRRLGVLGPMEYRARFASIATGVCFRLWRVLSMLYAVVPCWALHDALNW